MIAFPCSGCRKPLSANEDLAGKTVKCRSCGQMSVVPSSTARVGLENMRTLPPAHSQSSAPDVTHDLAAGEPGHDASLTSFLAPPQSDNELGRLGGFRILKILGHGGMGVVFQGEDPKLGRQVAIKAMLPKLAGNKVSQERFLREARTAGVLEHEHIVPILQVGEDRGAPFLVMPLLKGEPLDVRLQREPKLPVADILRIGREIAEGLAAAHERGLIHRDIKPANIWLESPKQRVKILDFGLARATDEKSNLTRLGSILGSPAYSSPEQAGGEKLDGRTDLWSLGIVLYRLCTGKLPFVGEDVVTTLMAVATAEPDSPREVNAAIPARLSDLVMKLLRKNAKDRPGSAREVIATLQALESEITLPGVPTTAVSASPFADLPEATAPTPIRKKTAVKPTAQLPARKPTRRRLPIIIGVAAAGLLLLVGGVILLWPTPQGTVRIEINDPDVKVTFDKDGPTITGAEKEPIKLKPGEHGIVVTRGDFTFETDKFVLKKGETVVLKIEFLNGKAQVVKDGKVIASADLPKPPKRPTPPPPEKVGEVRRFEILDGGVRAVDYSADGRFILTGSAVRGHDKTVRLWEVATGKELRRFEGHSGVIAAVALSPDGSFAVSSATDKTVLWDIKTGHELRRLEGDIGWVVALAVSADSKQILTGSQDRTMRLFNAATGKEVQKFEGHTMPVQAVAFSPDGKTVASGSWDTTIRLWNRATGKELRKLEGHTLEVHSVAYSPDGKRLLSGSVDKTLRLWDVEKAKVLRTFEGHTDRINCVAYSPDGRRALSASHDLTVRLWDIDTGKELYSFVGHGAPVWSVAFSPDGLYAVSGGVDGTARLWRLPALGAPPAATGTEADLKAVMLKLKELNPGFDGKETHVVDKTGVVTELQFVADNVKDISPVRALTGLEKLTCNGSDWRKGQLANLSPLKGMKLTSLVCYHTQVSDLSPLKNLRLTNLDLWDTPVADLSPLKDMKLTTLACPNTGVADLTPLKNMALTSLYLWQTPVRGLAPLKDMPLTRLDCGGLQVSDLSPLKDLKLTYLQLWSTPVADLSPLKDMKLTELHCQGTPVSDLTPLKNMPLTILYCNDTKVADLSPLRGMPLKDLHCDYNPERDATILKSISTLEKINDKPAKEVLGSSGTSADGEKQVKAVMDKLKELNPGFDGKETHVVDKDGVVTELQFVTDKVTDISPIRALTRLQKLTCTGSDQGKGQLADLSPLKGMKLTTLECWNNKLFDLSPLQGMKLTTLIAYSTNVSDLSPLKDLKLTHLGLGATKLADLTPLRDMTSLTQLSFDNTPVTDLKPLKNLKLTRLDCWNTPVSDLTPLQEMKLVYLNCSGANSVSDLSPLKAMKLTTLWCQWTRVADLKPLEHMKLTDLHCDHTPVADLAPLKGMPLKVLWCDFKPERDAAILRSIKTLEKINDKPAKEFLK